MTDRDETQLAALTSRRAVLLGAGAFGAVGVLAACGSANEGANGGTSGGGTSGGGAGGASSGGASSGGAASGGAASGGAPSGGASSGGASSGGASSGGASSGGAAGSGIKAADIPVGGGTIFPDQKVVITQPTQGTFKAFSAICTHQGCLVTTVENGKIGCPCHNSEFGIANGAVEQGPATKPLPPMTVTASGDTLTIA